MAIDDLKTKIDGLTSESELRELRNYADTRLQSLKEAKEMENKSEHENRYKGKYLLLYGRTVSMSHSEVNTQLSVKITMLNKLSLSLLHH